MFNKCSPSFNSKCYAFTSSQSIIDDEECAAEYSTMFNASNPKTVAEIAEVNQEIDAACRNLTTQARFGSLQFLLRYGSLGCAGVAHECEV
jgi:uncharacterized protein YfcZ (UPF0381/DUF406 family)